MAVRYYWGRLTNLDRFIVFAMIACCIFLFILFGLRRAGNAVVVIQDDRSVFLAPLAEAREVELHGPLGITRLKIMNGSARITDSPCPYKVCISMGEISRHGEIIACVPNHLLVQVTGDDTYAKESDYDLLSR